MSGTSFRLPNVVLGLVLASSLGAQMSGTYTIDPNGSGSRNFTDFQNAAYQLYVQGISGPVVFEAASATYSSNAIYLPPVPQTSSTNTITFRSKTLHGAKLAAGFMMTDYGPSFPIRWYIFDGLEFAQPTSSSRSNTAVALTASGGATTDIEIRNCKFVRRYIAASGTSSSSGTDQMQRWNVHHNLFTGGLYSSAKYCRFYGGHGIYIHHNEFNLSGTGGVAISLENGVNAHLQSRIYNNLIIGGSFGPSEYTFSQGILAYGARSVDIFHNTVVVYSQDGNGKPRGNSRCIEAGGFFARKSRAGNNILVNLGLDYCARYLNSVPYAFEADGNIYLTRLANGYTVNGTSLASWQKSSGLDKASVVADPLFVTSIATITKASDLNLQATSPAIGKAVNTPAYITDDFFGNPRASKATIGAIEYIPPSTFTPYGSGCAGTGGRVPAIGMSGELKLGSKNFLITLSNAKGGAGSAYFALGLTQATLNFGGRCTLLVSPQLLVLLPVSGLSGPGNGSSSLRLPIPNKPNLKGATAHAQWGVLDSAAAGIGVAFSNAATIKL